MFKAKDIVIKSINSETARQIVSMYHYSGKSTQNSQIHFGVFINNSLQGCLQFGPSIDKRRLGQNLGIGMNEFLELNRMALSDKLPKNSESRAISICLRILKKQYPFLKLIVSFADACQCGDGTIYRASGFKLHSYKKNNSLFINEDNEVDFKHGTKKYKTIAKKALDNKIDPESRKYISSVKKLKPLEGYQMKYVYFFDKELEKQFKFIDFKDIPKEVKMYKGQKCASGVESGTTSFQEVGSGESPTGALQLEAASEKV